MAEVRDGLNDLPAPFVRMGVAIDSTANEVPEETYETCGFHFQALRLCFLTALVFWAGQCARISVNAQTPPPAATITSVDAKTGLVTARINASGQLFQFTLTSKALLNRVHPGQDVYVNLRKRQVSLDDPEMKALWTRSELCRNFRLGAALPVRRRPRHLPRRLRGPLRRPHRLH